MKRALAVAVVAVAALGGPAWAACGSPTPIGHQLDSYFACADGGLAQALIYDITAPATDNSADIRTVCRATGAQDNGTGVDCIGLGAGANNDGQLAIQTDASISTWIGCPAPAGAIPKRIAVSVTASDGQGLILSVSGHDPGLAYQFEAAHPFDPDSGAISPVVCGPSGRGKITSVTRAGGNVTVTIQQGIPPVYSDCDPGTLGVFITQSGGAACDDAFSKTFVRGAVYSKTAACVTGLPVNGNMTGWTRSTSTPDAAGNASFTTTDVAAGNCLYVGTSGTVGGSPEFLTGITQVPPAGDASARATEVRVAKGQQGRIDVSWNSRFEVGLASYKVMIDKKGSLSEALSVAPRGAGGPASYSASIDAKNIQGGKAVVVRAVMTDGTFVDAAPVGF